MDMKQVIAERIASGAQVCFEGCNLCCSDLAAMLETPPDKKLATMPCRASAWPRPCARRRR